MCAPGALNQTFCFLSTIGRKINVGAEGEHTGSPLRRDYNADMTVALGSRRIVPPSKKTDVILSGARQGKPRSS